MERANSPMAGAERGRVALRVAVLLGLLCWLGGTGSALAAGTFVVDGADPTRCSDTAPGAGTEGNPPYCTISAAAKARGGPGTTLLVKPAIYRERVNVTASGAEGSPFVFQALGPGVVVDGRDDFSNPALWTPVSGTTVYLAASVTWDPGVGVFVDGARLTQSLTFPADPPPGAFRYIGGEGLYVNLGGDNPGTHQTLVSRRNNGFAVFGPSWVTIDGFTVTRTRTEGIRVGQSADGRPPNDITITHNTVTFAGSTGINVSPGTNLLIGSNVISDSGGNGIFLTGTSATIRDNEVFRNPGDGIQLYSSETISLQNRSWHNGRHGFALFPDNRNNVHAILHVGDVAWGNGGRGFSVQAGTSETRIFNCIGVNNGLTTGEFNLYAGGTAFVSNSNIFWNRTSQAPIKFNGETYATLAAFTAATGQDADSIQADPRFVNPEAGDFRLLPGSPAIDAADTSVANWPATDAAGQARVDDPATPDTGAGPVPYADRGALEFLPVGSPLAALTVTPSSGRVPLAVTADASGSADPDGTIVSYLFDFGDGTAPVQIQQPDPATATHTYTEVGTFTVTVTVTDNEGRAAAAGAPVTVRPPSQPPVAALTVTPASGTEPLTVTADASGSRDPDGPIVAYRFDFGDGKVVGPQPEARASHTYSRAGTFTVTVTVTDDLGATDTASATVTVVASPPSGNLVGNPSFESDTRGWSAYGGATLQRVPGGVEGTFALEVRGPATTTEFGINDSPNWVAKTLAAGTRYRFTAWVRAAVSTGRARLKVREYLTGVQVGGTTASPFVPLTPDWQLLTLDHATEAASSTLDFQVLDLPSAPGQVFQVDSIAIRIVTGTTTNQPPNGVIDSPAMNMTIPAGQSVTFAGTGTDPDGHLPLTFLWTFAGGAPNATVEDPGAVVFNTPGTYTVTFTVTDSLGVADPTPASRVITVSAPPNQAPNGVIDSPAANVTITVADSVTFTGTGTDPDNNLPLRFLWTFGGGAPTQSVEDPGAVTFSTPGTYTVTFTVTDSLGAADPTADSRVIQVVATSLVGNPSFETGTSGWKPYATADTVMERVPGGQEGAFALEVRGPATTTEFGINDSPNWVGRTVAAGTRYRFTAWVRADGSTGQARLRVREYLNGVQIGGTVRSAPVVLSPSWQMLTVDFIAGAAESTLDFQVLDYAPVTPGEVFQTDNIAIRVVP